MSDWIKPGVPAWHVPRKCWVLISTVYGDGDGGIGNCEITFSDGSRGGCNNWQLRQFEYNPISELARGK